MGGVQADIETEKQPIEHYLVTVEGATYEFTVHHDEDGVTINVEITGGWLPQPINLSRRLIRAIHAAINAGIIRLSKR